jgi:hypothetical protein
MRIAQRRSLHSSAQRRTRRGPSGGAGDSRGRALRRPLAMWLPTGRDTHRIAGPIPGPIREQNWRECVSGRRTEHRVLRGELARTALTPCFSSSFPSWTSRVRVPSPALYLSKRWLQSTACRDRQAVFCVFWGCTSVTATVTSTFSGGQRAAVTLAHVVSEMQQAMLECSHSCRASLACTKRIADVQPRRLAFHRCPKMWCSRVTRSCDAGTRSWVERKRTRLNDVLERQ